MKNLKAGSGERDYNHMTCSGETLRKEVLSVSEELTF
jgi:hypothetical protein